MSFRYDLMQCSGSTLTMLVRSTGSFPIRNQGIESGHFYHQYVEFICIIDYHFRATLDLMTLMLGVCCCTLPRPAAMDAAVPGECCQRRVLL